MSETTVTLSADQLPILPETHIIEPIVQCGVLYLGTAPPAAGLHGLDSVQEPFSHRYPVDGINTVRGIDAVLSVYDNGIQLAFARQPHSVIYFPITSLIYCASLRFSIIENDQTNQTSIIDWRFMPFDKSILYENKHPPLFCARTQRTHVLPGDECHCFITKSIDAALALVRTISQIYVNIKPGTRCFKSPIFYQLDRYGRKLSEINGIIYISPANDDDSQLNKKNSKRLTNELIAQNCLLDPSFDGFFYRTDASLIEQWQLWDDDIYIGSRPHPPASPFGLHEGLYHDDTTHEIQRYLRHMDGEESSSSSSFSCSSSNVSSSSSSLLSIEYPREQNRDDHYKSKNSSDADEFDESFANLMTSSFEPILTGNSVEIKKTHQAPIIIEKVVPKPSSSLPILNPCLSNKHSNYNFEQSQQSFHAFNSPQESTIKSIPLPDFSYQINERGEKITKEGNRILFMDVVQPGINDNTIDPNFYTKPKSRPRSHIRRSKRVPVINIESIERLFQEKQSEQHPSPSNNEKSRNYSNPTNHSATTDMSQRIDEYFQDHKTNSNKHDAETTMDNFQSFNKKKQRRRKTSINNSQNETHRHRRNRSILTVGPAVNYSEHPSLPQNERQVLPLPLPLPMEHKPPIPPVLSNKQLNKYLSDIYGTAGSIKSSSSSSNQQETIQLNNTNQPFVINPTYVSTFRYMQSSINPNLLREYRNGFNIN